MLLQYLQTVDIYIHICDLLNCFMSVDMYINTHVCQQTPAMSLRNIIIHPSIHPIIMRTVFDLVKLTDRYHGG